jgi:hypothetical protein
MNTNQIIAIVVLVVIVALILHIWIEWKRSYNRRAVRYVSRVVNESQFPLYTKTGEIEWHDACADVPTFKAGGQS